MQYWLSVFQRDSKQGNALGDRVPDKRRWHLINIMGSPLACDECSKQSYYSFGSRLRQTIWTTGVFCSSVYVNSNGIAAANHALSQAYSLSVATTQTGASMLFVNIYIHIIINKPDGLFIIIC